MLTRRFCEKWGQEQISPTRYQGGRAKVHFVCGVPANLSVSVASSTSTPLLNVTVLLVGSKGHCHDGAEAG